MSLPSSLPASAIEYVLALLVRLILPNFTDDPAAARALALDMLADYQPRTVRELRFAGEAVGCSLNALQALSDAGQRDLAPPRLTEARRFACAVSRTGAALEQRLEAMQRARRAGPAEETEVPPPVDADPPAAATHETVAPQVNAPADSGANLEASPPGPPAGPAATLAEAEADYGRAEKLLSLMKAHWKGAPPPHSKAAQDIQQQQRILNGARIKLQQARRHAVGAAPALSDAR